jgi:hypothetical protein
VADAVLMGAGTGAMSGAMMGGMMGGVPGAVVGGVAGGAMGALGGMGQQKADDAAQKALKAQQAAILAEMQRRANGVGKARQTFGDINNRGKVAGLNTNQNLGKTLEARSQIQGNIDQGAHAVRDLGMQGITDTAQQTGAGIRQASASRGLMGSSLDASAKQSLLSGYTNARSGLAGAVDATRQAGWNGIQGQQQAFEAAAGGGNINPQMGSISTAGMAAGAQGQMGATMAGNMLGQGIGLLNYGALAEANGGQGIQAMGLPSLGLTKPTTAAPKKVV